jgi:hypothetical protein
MNRKGFSVVPVAEARQLIEAALNDGFTAVATVSGYSWLTLVGDKSVKTDLPPGDWFMVLLSPTPTDEPRGKGVRLFKVEVASDAVRTVGDKSESAVIDTGEPIDSSPAALSREVQP